MESLWALWKTEFWVLHDTGTLVHALSVPCARRAVHGSQVAQRPSLKASDIQNLQQQISARSESNITPMNLIRKHK